MTAERPLDICFIGSSDSVHTQTRARALANRGHRVLIVDEAAQRFGPVEQAMLHAISALPKLRGLGTIYAHLQTLRRLRADLFHVQFAAGADAWLAAVAGLRPLVVSVWGGDVMFAEQGNATPLAQRLTADLLNAADLVTAESDRVLDAVRRLRPEGRTALIHWGIDRDIFHRHEPGAARAKLGIPAESPILYSPRLLTRFYNIHLIVEALPAIVARYPSVRLLIGTYYADALYRAELEAALRRAGVEQNAIFLPVLEPREIAALYNSADLVVSIPSADCVPRTLMEAMACGAPVIISRIPAYDGFAAHEESAYIVPIDAAAVAAAAIRLLGDRDLTDRLRRNGLARAEEAFDQRAEAARVEALYREVLANPRPRQPRLARAAMLCRLLLHFGLHR